jgi:hypothetical protein
MKKESVVLEIRAAAGRDDAKLLVEEMTSIYRKAAIWLSPLDSNTPYGEERQGPDEHRHGGSHGR